MPDSVIQGIIDGLEENISKEVGNMQDDELSSINNTFDETLAKALQTFTSNAFDNDGFIKKMREMDIGGDKKDKDIVKNVLNNIRNDYVDTSSLNQSDLIMRRDIVNICTQMPEMRDVVYIIRDSIIECNVATGEVSRTLNFENHSESEAYQAQLKDVETKHDLLMAIKNFIVPRTLMVGEMYIHVVPYAKLFAELEAVHDMKFNKNGNSGKLNFSQNFRESVPNTVSTSFVKKHNLYNDNNLKSIMESVSPITKTDTANLTRIDKHGEHASDSIVSDSIVKDNMRMMLENIEVCNGSSLLMEEFGKDGFEDFILRSYKETGGISGASKDESFFESMHANGKSILGKIDEDQIDFKSYEHIKGCYVKYLDALRIVPIRMDRKIIGYYYISTTMDIQSNSSQPNGLVDLSFQHYTRDKNLVDKLSNLIIRSFDKKMLEKNIKLKTEIAEIIMAHKFSEGRLSFIFIPENEIVRLVINEDENGKGHSILEPTLFPARMYLMLTLYNMIYTLNNNTTRIHYLRSSGLNKDYAAQIQRTIRKFQSRRITIDDIYSYSGVLSKIGGMGEMVLPSGRGDYRALDTDTIEAAQNPISIEFLEQQRRQAISGTGVPQLMVINAIDEVDFAKTLELSNTRFLSTVSSYKIDFNRGLTVLYRLLMKYSTDLEDDVIQSFRYKFNAIKQQDLNITADMITQFNSLVEIVMSFYYTKEDMEDEDNKPSAKQMLLRKELAKEYLPQLDFDSLDEIIKKVNLESADHTLQKRVNEIEIEEEEIKNLTGKDAPEV